MRRKYPKVAETRGAISCCTPAENSQLNGRTPHPFMIDGEYTVPGTALPKLGVSHGPHSPLGAPLVRSHCGTKSFAIPPFTPLSVHPRAVCVMSVLAGLFASA